MTPQICQLRITCDNMLQCKHWLFPLQLCCCLLHCYWWYSDMSMLHNINTYCWLSLAIQHTHNGNATLYTLRFCSPGPLFRVTPHPASVSTLQDHIRVSQDMQLTSTPVVFLLWRKAAARKHFEGSWKHIHNTEVLLTHNMYN